MLQQPNIQPFFIHERDDMVTKLTLYESHLITISQLNMSDSIKISISNTCFLSQNCENAEKKCSQ